ncbi:MAG TPA: hypothetical protein VIU15_27000 [Streptomyces sp.]
MIVRRTGAGRLARRVVLPLVVCSAMGVLATPAVADGTGTHGLALQVTVNTRPGLEAVRRGIRAGTPVVKSYRLVNRGGADLHDVRVDDPGLPGVTIHCPGGRRLSGLTSTTCTALTTARPGVWEGVVRASGRIPYLKKSARATARSGYAGVVGVLSLTETVAVGRGRRAAVRYEVANRGNRRLYDVRISDPLTAREGIDCEDGRPVVRRLEPGHSAACRAVVRRGPGTYTGRGLAEGSDRVSTLGRGGTVVPSPTLTARATARFVIPRPLPPGEPVRPTPPGHWTRPRPSAPPENAAVPGRGVVGMPPAGPPPVAAAPAFPPVLALQPAVVPPAVVPPAAVPPAVVPPAAVPPGVAPRQNPNAPSAVAPLPDRPAQARPRPLLRYFYRQGEGPTGLGLAVALFLVLMPAALAAALLGSRRR